MAEHSIDNSTQTWQALFSDDQVLKRLVTEVVQQAMQVEVQAQLQARPHERSAERRGHRNGTKPRRIKTRVGELELQVPQVRGCEPYHPSMFARWQRSERALLTACAEMYFQGVSTRKVQQVLDTMCQGQISAATVSRVSAELDEKLADFVTRRLDQSSWPYLQIDARYEKVRVDGRVVSQAVLVVVGFDATGRRQVLDYRVADSESETSWGEVFRSLKDRGVRGVVLVVSDAHRGMVAALKRHFQSASWQRCRVHFKRELGHKVSYKQLKALHRDLASVFAGGDERECLQRAEEMASRWASRYPAVAKMLREGLGDCLTVLQFPEHHRRKLTSTNLLENIMRRLRKRSRVVGVFPSRASCARLLGSQLLELHEQWLSEERAYFNMEIEAPVAA